MATILDKDLIRESTITVDERNIQVTLGEDQTISFKLKGMKSGIVSIGIKELYNQLAGIDDDKPKSIVVPTGGVKKTSNGDPMLSLHDVRHRLNVSGLDYATTAKLDSIMKDLIEETKKR